MLASWRAQDKKEQPRHPGGRPAKVTDEAILTIVYLLAANGASQNVNAMTSLVVYGLSDTARTMLGLGEIDVTPDSLNMRLWRAYHRLLDVVDPYPGPRKERLQTARFEELEAAVDPALRDLRQRRLHTLNNSLLAATLMALPREVRRRWKGNAAVDATFVPAYGQIGNPRNGGKDKFMGIEPHAGWYVRDGDHGLGDASAASSSGETRTKLRKAYWGWEATLLVMGANDPRREATFPQLITGISFDKPGASPGRKATEALTYAHRAQMEQAHPEDPARPPAGYLVGDRAYGCAPRPEDFQSPARSLGYRLVFDLRSDELGHLVDVAGAKLLEGNLYCPAIQGHRELVEATRQYRDATQPSRIEFKEWVERMEQRRPFLLHPNGRITPDGKARMRCPAMGSSPSVKCPLRPRADAEQFQGLKKIPVRALPDVPTRGGCCTNAGGDVTISNHETFSKYAMDLQFGSADWRATYQTHRQSIESFNRYVKDGSFTGLSNPDRRRVRGFTSAFVIVTSLVAAANLRKSSRWLAEQPVIDSRGRGPLKNRKPRRRERGIAFRGRRAYVLDQAATSTEPKAGQGAHLLT